MNEVVNVRRRVVAEAGGFRVVKITIQVEVVADDGTILFQGEQTGYWLESPDGSSHPLPECQSDAAAESIAQEMAKQAADAARRRMSPTLKSPGA